MDTNPRLTIRELLLFTFVVAVLVAIPLNAHRVTLSVVGRAVVWLSYSGLVFAVVGYVLWLLSGRRWVVPIVILLLFAMNFAPECVTLAEFAVSGDNERTGLWLAAHGLDYDPWLSIPCWCTIAPSGG